MLATDKASPKTSPRPTVQPETQRERRAERGGNRDLTMAPGTAMRRTDKEVLEREVKADAEHQQDDADLGELGGEPLVGDETGRVAARRHTPARR